MAFTHDIFISYGHLDDEDPAGDVKGWVDLLVERLPRLISNSLGYQPKIWRDDHSLRGNDLLRGAIDEGVSQSLVLIPIVSRPLRAIRVVPGRIEYVLQHSDAARRASLSFPYFQGDKDAVATPSGKQRA